MRVLQVFNRYLERGGEEVSVERISNVLSQRHEVFHCYFDSRTWKQESGAVASAKQLTRMFHNPDAALRLRRHIEACRPDLVLVHNLFPVGSLTVLRVVAGLNVPVAHMVHNFRPYSVNGYLWAAGRLLPQGLKKNFLPEILVGAWQSSRLKTAAFAMVLWAAHALRVYGKIDGWLAISQFMREAFIKAGQPAEKVFLLRHSWDPGPEPDSRPDDPPYFLFLGRLIESKGVSTLLEAWKIASAHIPTARLVIGGDGPLALEVTAAAAGLPRCEYLGQVEGEKKTALLDRCLAMVIPSVWWEPLGLVVYEAYDHAKPVLAARAGGLAETVSPGETGWLHEPGNAQELAAQMVEAVGNPMEAARRGGEGRRWLLENTRTADWLDAFDEIAGKLVARKTRSSEAH